VCAVYSAGTGSWSGVVRECVCCIQCREGQLVWRIEGMCVLYTVQGRAVGAAY
jgi:hypothetical protein